MLEEKKVPSNVWTEHASSEVRTGKAHRGNITSKIQNTLADNPIGDQTNESKRLKTSDMVAVLANRPERREKLTRVSAKRVSDKICAMSMPDPEFIFDRISQS